MTRRKPLVWHDTEHGQVPGCVTCADRLFSARFAEAVASVSIEHGAGPGDLGRRALDHWHAMRHPDP